jgi:catechol 2,3-dioxygenase-like lactoylglutathione lyase family enzyme
MFLLEIDTGLETIVDRCLVVGFDHVSTSSRDVDRLTEFYRRVFGIEPLPGFPMIGPGGRKIVLIPLANGTTLQATEVDLAEAPALLSPAAAVFYGTARFDHASFLATDSEAFEELRSRLVAEEASTGEVHGFGSQKFFAFRDPDGYLAEVVVNSVVE